MKKRLFALSLVLILALSLTAPTFAFVDHNYLYTAVDALDNQRLAELGETTLPAMSETWQFDFRVDIVSTTEGDTIQEYAELFYTKYEYGWGENKDGSVLMILVDDNGDSINFNDYYIHGGGLGEAIHARPDSESLYVSLDMLLTGEGVACEAAGETIADAVEVYMGVMASLVMAEDPARAAATGDQAVAAIPAEAEVVAEAPAVAPAEAPAAAPVAGQNTFILDYADKLSTFTETSLESRAKTVAENYGCGVYVLTVETMDGAECREFAKNYYLENDLGVGEGKNGILFMIAMDTRDYVTITYGKDPADASGYGIGIRSFTDDVIEVMENDVVFWLGEDDYDEAFGIYMDYCEEHIAYFHENGEAKEVEGPIVVMLAIVIFVPLLIALIVCLVFLSQMKTANAATEAGNYVSELTLTSHSDRYTHTTTQRRKIETDDDNTSVDSDGFGGSKGGKF